MTLSPSELEDVKAAAAREIADRFFAGVDLDDLNTLEISTAASFLGIPVERAARVLPIIEVGPRSRRVRISDFKAYQAAHTTKPR